MTILIADDEYLVQHTLRKLLNDYGIEDQDIHCVDHGTAMVSHLMQHPVDMAFVDIRMPLLTGLDAIRQCLLSSPGTSFYILTGYGNFDYARQAIQLGVKDFLLKPIDGSAISAILKKEQHHKTIRREQERDKYKAAVSSLLLSKTPGTASSLCLLPCLCIHDMASDPELDALYQLETVFPGIRVVILPYEDDVCVCLVSEQLSVQSLVIQSVKQLFHQVLTLRHNDSLTVYMAASMCRAEEFMQTLKTLKTCSSIHILYGNHKCYLLNSRLDQQCRLYLPLCSLLHRLHEACLAGSYMECSGLGEKLLMEYKKLQAEGLPSHNQLEHLNLYLSSAFPKAFTHVTDLKSLESMLIQVTDPLLCKTGKKYTSMEQVLQYVDQHFTEDISMNTLADMFQLTPNYLSAQFKKETTVRFTDYITSLRMAKAKELLTQTDMQIRQIGMKIGYYTASHFIKTFVSYEGMTPLDYRNSH